ncbi:hypothetical protein BGZ49_003897 [Haplosporangium sp. Z 27]|nr:hypothetical protein BGZ49_003897 [Haplosporangium sp. Z 27]
MWQLSAILNGHKGDVKAVIAPTDSMIVSVSRDKTVRTWQRQSENTFSEERIFLGHTNYVNSVAFIGASEVNPNGLIVTGGSDKLINVWNPEDASAPVYTLVGHTDNVCSLFADTDGHIVSGSWDKTAKIWRNWQCVHTLEGHTQAIWGVLELEHEVIVTASADKTIAMWKNGKKIKTITGHEDCVRSLALLPGIGFVSCGNDGAVIVWSNNGDPVQALDGHTSFVYSLATLPTGEIFSSGEDRTVRAWEHGVCTQTIIHPCVSVWCVAALPNGDIVSGGSDGFVRVFTRNSERVANAETLKAYDEENAAAAIPSNQVGDIKKDDLPGPEALEQPGRKDQDVKMVRVGNTVEAHMWSNAEQSWSKIGEVVDAVGQNRKQLYGGVEYDHVFDIDVGEGVPALKLPFNVTENPYTAAQTFLTKHDLPQSYLDQVADFITKNARAVSQGETASFGDPLTGGSRYTPAQTSASSLGSYNPWGNDAPKTQPSIKRLIPQLTNVPFKDANLPAIHKKLLQLNAELSSSGAALDKPELEQLDSLIKFLGSPPKQVTPQPQYTSLLLKIFNTWPEASRFPALDLLRLLSLYSTTPAETPDLLKTLLTATHAHETSLMLVARLVVNFCETEIGKEVAMNEIGTVLDFMEDSTLWQSTNKNLKLAVATVYMSYSTLLLKRHDDDALAIQYVGVLTKILEKEREQQVQYRLLVALGNLIFAHESARESAAIFGVKGVLQSAVLSRPTSEKISTGGVAKQTLESLKARLDVCRQQLEGNSRLNTEKRKDALREEIHTLEMQIAQVLGLHDDNDEEEGEGDNEAYKMTTKQQSDIDTPESTHLPSISSPEITRSPSPTLMNSAKKIKVECKDSGIETPPISSLHISNSPFTNDYDYSSSSSSGGLLSIPSNEAESVILALADAGEGDQEVETLLKEQAMMEQRVLKRRREEADEALALSMQEEEIQTLKGTSSNLFSSLSSSTTKIIDIKSLVQSKLDRARQEQEDAEMARLFAESDDIASINLAAPSSSSTAPVYPVFHIFEKKTIKGPTTTVSHTSGAASSSTSLTFPKSFEESTKVGTSGQESASLSSTTALLQNAAAIIAAAATASNSQRVPQNHVDLTKPVIDLTKQVHDISNSDDDIQYVSSSQGYSWGPSNILSRQIHGPWNTSDEEDEDGWDDDDEGIGSYDYDRWERELLNSWSYNRVAQREVDYPRHLSTAESEKELRDLLANVEAAEEDIPPQDRTGTPDGMASDIFLLEHQKIGLTWLQKMEDGTNRGGILGDDMGLGKTIQTMALIVSRPSGPIDDPVIWDERKIYHEPPPESTLVKTKATLVLAPVSLMLQWAEELRSKTEPGLLKVYVYHGKDRFKDPELLRRYDVIITTVTTLAGEMGHKDINPGKCKRIGTLFKAHYHRVVIDEAHLIKNKTTKSAKACTLLSATYRWCLTGTPIQNSIDELYSLIRFLRIKPYCNWDEFRTKISMPIKKTQQYRRAMDRVQVLMKAICLRRTKTSNIDGKPILNLPDRKVDKVHTDFSLDERAFYDALETRTRERFNAYVKAGTVMKNYSNILVLLLRLRQACCHPHLINDFEKATEGGAPAGQKAHTDRLLDNLLEDIRLRLIERGLDAVECPICMDVGEESVILSGCGHIYCRACIIAHLSRHEEDDRKCPECRRLSPIDNLISVADFNARFNPPIPEDIKGKGKALDQDEDTITDKLPDVEVPAALDEWISSSKIEKMIEIVRGVMAKGEKIIIFSQFTSLLTLIEKPLANGNIKFLRYDGAMTVDRRNEAIRRMINDPQYQVMLISLKCGSLGLNLTVANHVVIMDPWWNPSLENQAIDRVHRIGQNKDVCVHRLCIPNTVEDRIFALQEKKKALADGALGEGEVPKLAKLGLQELMYLFRGG